MTMPLDHTPGPATESDAGENGGVRIRHRVLEAGSWATAGFVVEKGIAFLQLIVLTRLLLPGDFGLMAASAAVLLAIQMVSELGLEPAVIAKPNLTDEDLRVAWTLSVIRGLLLTVGLWSVAGLIAGAMKIPELTLFLRVHALGILLQSFRSPALIVLLKQLDLRRRVSFDLSRRLVESIATIGLAWWWQSAWALVGGQLIAFLFSSLLSFWIAPCRIRWSLERAAFRGLWNYGRYQNMTAWFLFAVMSGGDFVVGRLQGAAGLGQYQLAMAIPTMIGIRAMSMISQITMPTYALIQNDRPGVLRALSLQMSLTGMVVVPMAMMVAIVAPYLVPFLFGPSWAAAVEPLRVLCLFAIAAAFCSVMAAFHCGANRPELQTRIWALMCACYVPMVIPFTMMWGLVGAAWALTVTFLVGLGLHLKATVKVLGSEALSAFEPLQWAGGLVLLVGCGIALSQAVPSLWMAQWLGALCGLLGVSVYGWHVWARESLRLRTLWGS